MLASRDYRVCQRGDVTVFLLRYDYDVGEVKSVRLWHDSSGDSPAWLLNDSNNKNYFAIKCIALSNNLLRYAFVFMNKWIKKSHLSFENIFLVLLHQIYQQ